MWEWNKNLDGIYCEGILYRNGCLGVKIRIWGFILGRNWNVERFKEIVILIEF